MRKNISVLLPLAAVLVLFAGCPQNNNKSANPQGGDSTPPGTPAFTVTFDVQGRGKTPQALTVPKDSLLTAAQTPPLKFSGWEFGGWYKEAGCTNPWNNASDTVTANTTLYAKWTKNGSPAVQDLWQSKTPPYPNGRGTNGEILVVKARKTTGTKEPVYLVFQSLPDGPNRKKVTIHWRELLNGPISVTDFVSASEWHSYVVENGNSAYSTMAIQRDGGIGFLYERNTRGAGLDYDIAYKNLPIDVITNGAYEAVVLGTGSEQCPYTDLEGKPVEASVKEYYQKEKLHWKE